MAAKVVALRSSAVTIDDAVSRFLADRDLAIGTRRVYALTFNNLAVDLGGDTTLGEVTGDDLQRHLKARYVSVAPATYNRNLAAIQSLMAWAARKRLIVEDPTI